MPRGSPRSRRLRCILGRADGRRTRVLRRTIPTARRRIPAQPRQRPRQGGFAGRHARRRVGRRPVGRHARLRDDPAVGGRHGRAGLLHLEGHGDDHRVDPRRPWAPRPRRTDRASTGRSSRSTARDRSPLGRYWSTARVSRVSDAPSRSTTLRPGTARSRCSRRRRAGTSRARSAATTHRHSDSYSASWCDASVIWRSRTSSVSKSPIPSALTSSSTSRPIRRTESRHSGPPTDRLTSSRRWGPRSWASWQRSRNGSIPRICQSSCRRPAASPTAGRSPGSARWLP